MSRGSAFAAVASLVVSWALACPVQAQNLVVNGDFEAGNSGFSTDYQFIESGTSVSPGTYGIHSDSQSFNPAYELFKDHTSGSGQMMLVDGYDPNSLVWSQIVPVTAGTEYKYTVWYAAAPPAPYNNPAVLEFRINGMPVGQVDIGTEAGVWKSFSITWATGPGTSAELQIYDANPQYANAGDDFALDDISFGSPAQAYTLGDVARCLQITGGISAAEATGIDRLDVVRSDVLPGRLDITDAALLARKVAGLAPNP